MKVVHVLTRLRALLFVVLYLRVLLPHSSLNVYLISDESAVCKIITSRFVGDTVCRVFVLLGHRPT
jgi:hypothetical protein